MTFDAAAVLALHENICSHVRGEHGPVPPGGVGGDLRAYAMKDGQMIGAVDCALAEGEDVKKEAFCMAFAGALRQYGANGYLLFNEAWLSRPTRMPADGVFQPARLDPAKVEVIVISTVYPKLRKIVSIFEYDSETHVVGDEINTLDSASGAEVSGRFTDLLDDA